MFHVFNNNYEYESDGDKSKVLSIKKYFNQIKPYLVDIINNLNSKVNGKFNLKRDSMRENQIILLLLIMKNANILPKKIFYTVLQNNIKK